jgi:hypothetical protein
VEHEHAVEVPGGRVGHQPLELWARLGLPPPGMEVAVLADEIEVVLRGELRDCLALRVWGKSLALLLGGLTDVGNCSLLDRLDRTIHRALPGCVRR